MGKRKGSRSCQALEFAEGRPDQSKFLDQSRRAVHRGHLPGMMTSPVVISRDREFFKTDRS